MIKVLVIGAMGRMGLTVCEAVRAQEDMSLAAAVDSAFADPEARAEPGGVPAYEDLEECLASANLDVAVDFTIPGAVYTNVITCLNRGVHCVVGTTGLSEQQFTDIEAEARVNGANCFIAPNFAVGAVLMMQVARQIVRHFPSVEVIELHHDEKIDAPSGTALRTADLLASERGDAPEPPGPEGNAARGLIQRGIPIHSVRLPGLVAHQEVVFGGPGQTLSIRHDSISRESFMPGVMLAVRRVSDLEEPLVIGLENIL